MSLKNVVKVMNFHALLRVDKSRRAAAKFGQMEQMVIDMLDQIMNNRNIALDMSVLRFPTEAPALHIYLGGEDVSSLIRTEEVGMAASAVGANPAVRAFLLDMQRDMARKQDVLMDGRDIGTVVLPDATVKIFLTASPEARATRRWKEYQAKGMPNTYEEVLADVKQRDYQDTHRAAAPLKQAEDAVLLDTSELNFEQSLDAMKQIIAQKVG